MKHHPSRRQFLVHSSLISASTFAFAQCTEQPLLAGPQETQKKKKQPNLAWQDPAEWGVEGRAFDDTLSYYNRLPGRAKDKVRKQVWDLSQQSAGISVRFNTDSPAIHVRYNLTSTRLAMPHMPATSVSGVDLYAKDGEGRWRWVSALKANKQEINSRLVGNLLNPGDKLREFMLYTPLYNGLTDLRIGVTDKAKFETVAPRTEKPILFYGTSIMHGACASRSGMAIPAIIGRRLDRPTLNLGFSGNGRMETEVGEFLCELDPLVFAIDCLPNMNAKAVTERCEPLVKQIRAARPETPILLVEDRVFANAWIRTGGEQGHAVRRAALKKAYDRLIEEGVENLHYLKCTDLLGTDGEATTDGSHPNDLGMMRYADAYEKALANIIK